MIFIQNQNNRVLISTCGAHYMTLDVKNFYLNTPMVRYEYVRIKIDDIPEEIIVEYKLLDKVTTDGYVYVEIQKGMYGCHKQEY